MTAARLAGKLSSVTKGTAKTRDGREIDITQYAHGAGVALGLLVTYAFGDDEPTLEEIVGVAMDWSDKVANGASEHPENVTRETIDLREEVADHE